LVSAAQKAAYWKDLWDNERGPLFRVKFLRVVLDEAAAIKNHLSQTSVACRSLEAFHYWAISGLLNH
jgi:SNF2 family DNA or RNA helicase